MSRLAALPFVALLATPAPAQDFTILSPEQIGQIFCISRLGNDMAPVEAILTPELRDAIAAAEGRNADWEKANPGEKPPLGDGIPWQAGSDYAAECTVGEATTTAAGVDVAINYGFPEYPPGNFTDTLNLRLVPGSQGEEVWRIDNVDFADGNMRDYLVLAFDFE